MSNAVGTMGSESHFNRLPRDLASRILLKAANGSARILCQLGTVCKQFGELIKDAGRISWEFQPGDCLGEARALEFLHSAQRVTDLDLGWGPRRRDGGDDRGPPPCISFLLGALMMSPKLKRLSVGVYRNAAEGLFQWHPAAEHFFASIPRFCPDLEHLYICNLYQARLDRPLSSRSIFPCLKNVHLRFCHLSGAFVESLVGACPSLEDLYLFGSTGITTLQIKSASLRELALDETGEFSEKRFVRLQVDAPELVRLAVDLVPAATTINAPKLQFLYLGSFTYSESRGKVVNLGQPWVLQQLDGLGDWDVGHLSAVLLACTTVDILDLTSAYPTKEDGQDGEVALAGFLQGLNCTQDMRIKAWKFFGSSWDSDLLSFGQRYLLTSLRELSIDINTEFSAPDEKKCKRLVAISPNLNKLHMIVDRYPEFICPPVSTEFEQMLSCFKDALEREWPQLRVSIYI